ncbi:MAG: MmcQ/YjbR family DNA-binding protein [Streptosporangiaceae bacterium]
MTVGDSTPLARLRAICLSLPEAAERESHGEPAWFAGTGRMFACFADHHHDDVLACWCAAPLGRQHELTEQDPGRYFVPPYVGSRGWLGLRLDVPVDWTEIAEIVQDGYREVATRRLVALLDGSNHAV